MDQHTQHWVQPAGDGQQDRQEVQPYGEGHIHLDRGHHPAGEPQEMEESADIIVYQRDIRRVHRQVTAVPPMAMPTSAFFKAEASLMPSVHAYGPAFPLAPVDPGCLVLGETFRADRPIIGA